MSLRKSENNILLILVWSPTYHGQTLEVLSDWIKTQESMKLYQRLIGDLRLQQTPESFALTLAALLCRERLLPYNMDDMVHAVRGSYLADFDAILKDQDTSNRRAVFDQMILSLVRVLNTLDHLDTSTEIVRLLTQVLDGEATTLGPMEDQYCDKKFRGHDHDRASVEAIDALFKCMKPMVKSGWNADADWTFIPSLVTAL